MEASSLLFGFLAAVMNTTTTQTILTGTSDAFQGNLVLQVVVDADSVATGFQATNGTTTQSYDLSSLTTGTVLYSAQGHNVVTLTSSDFDTSHGGTMIVNYLHNAITNDTENLSIDIERNGDTWQMLDDGQSGNEVVTQAYFKSNKVLGQTVGIDSITFSP